MGKKPTSKSMDTIGHLLLLLGGIIMVFPFVWMLLSSLKTTAEITRIPPYFFPDNWLNFNNFQRVLVKYKFSSFFKNSLYYASVKTVITIYTSALMGYVLGKIRFKGRNTIFIMVIATMMIPWPVTLIPSYQLMVWLKWIDKDISILHTAVLSGFGVFLMKQFSESLPDSLIEAARIDGAGEFRIFHRIVFPMLKNAVSALAIFTFLWEWDNFLWPYLMLSNMGKYTLPIGLAMTKGQFVADYGPMFAGIAISVLPVLVVYLIFQKAFIQGITIGSIKG